MTTPPVTTTPAAVRCWQCKRLLAEVVTPPWRILCPRCKAINTKGM